MSFWDDLNAVDDQYMDRTKSESDDKERITAFIIGALAVFLAFGVAGLDRWLEPACPRSSVSHYFLEPFAGTFFVMALTFVGAFMIAYRGENKWDGHAATIGGIGALVLAFSPTDGLGCATGTLMDLRPAVVIEVPPGFGTGDLVEGERFPDAVAPAALRAEDGALEGVELRIGTEGTQRWHFAGAGVLFVVLLYFAGVAFPRVKDEDTDAQGKKLPSKRIRNTLYYLFLALMVVGFLMIVFSETMLARALSLWLAGLIAALPYAVPEFGDVVRPVYHGELLAFLAFGLVWLLKGRFLLRVLLGP
ncbi:MAG: hypothetical protein AAGH73_05955 [Pseudomonadota bacterium]